MIKCQCGGTMKVTNVNSGKDYAREQYQCKRCGARGSKRIDFVTNQETKSGAVA